MNESMRAMGYALIKKLQKDINNNNNISNKSVKAKLETSKAIKENSSLTDVKTDILPVNENVVVEQEEIKPIVEEKTQMVPEEIKPIVTEQETYSFDTLEEATEYIKITESKPALIPVQKAKEISDVYKKYKEKEATKEQKPEETFNKEDIDNLIKKVSDLNEVPVIETNAEPVVEKQEEVKKPTIEELLSNAGNIVNENINLKKQLEAMKKEIIKLKENNVNLKSENANVKSNVDSLNKKNSELESKNQNLSLQLQNSNLEKDKMKAVFSEQLQSEVNARNLAEEQYRKQYEDEMEKVKEHLNAILSKASVSEEPKMIKQ